MASGGASKSEKSLSPEEINVKFNELRNSQRQLVGKISELEMEIKEHDLVIETLEGVESSRKCFRMVGGVLCEREVQDVNPALKDNRDKIKMVVKSLTSQMEKKGVELQEFTAKYNIRLRGDDDKKDNSSGGEKAKSSGVLVADS